MTHEAALKGTLTLILGGARSGKSQFGQTLAQELGGDDVLFVATAESRDQEMARRIDMHRRSRPSAWQTLEQPLDVGRTLSELASLPSVVLVDCLTLLVSNVLLSGDAPATSSLSNSAGAMDDIEQRVQTEVNELIRLVQQQAIHLVIVSGEVGMGLVPEHALGRSFRDLLGWSNQTCAKVATSTYLMVAGLPINATAIATGVQQAAGDLRGAQWVVVQP